MKQTEEQIVDKIRNRMKKKDLTYKALSEKSGVNINTVDKVVNGKASPTLRVLLALFEVLKIRIR